LPKFSGRYRPEVSAWLSWSSLASACGSIAAISIGNCQLTLKPACPCRSTLLMVSGGRPSPLIFDQHVAPDRPAGLNGLAGVL